MRRLRASIAGTSALLALLAASAGSAVAQAEKESLRETRQELEKAKERAAELSRDARLSESELRALRQRLIAVAARARERAASVAQLERRMADLTEREADKRKSLESQRGQLASLIAALQRIASHPPTALIALPAEPNDTIRSALLLRGTVPAIESRARLLAQDLDALAELRTALVGARVRLDEQRRHLQRDRADLEDLVARKTEALKGTRDAQQKAAARAAELGREARSLQDLVRKLDAERAAARAAEEQARREREARAREETTRRTRLREVEARKAQEQRAAAEAARERQVAALPRPRVPRSGNLPVAGRILHPYGSAANAATADGVTVATQPGATVIAPGDGVVVFAGPFRGLGKLLIIEHQGAYHLLLAGLARIDTAVGEEVLAGEPVGIMPTAGPSDPTLYLELRRKGRPINPTPWLAARRDRKNG